MKRIYGWVHSRSTLLAAALAVVSLVGLWVVPLQAQSGTPRLTITGINVDSFPDVRFTVYGEQLGTELTGIELEVAEDGNPIQAESGMLPVGVQLLLVLDASNNIAANGGTGVPRIEEVFNNIDRLTQDGILLEGKDWLAGVAFGRDNDAPTPLLIAPWTVDHQAVLNAFYTYEPNPANVLTPLIEQIFFGLEQFADARVPDNLQRHMVVFSDGADLLSARQSDDLIRRAAELGVRVHTIQVGPPLEDARRNLQRIADNTGGTALGITANTPDVSTLWQLIAAGQEQREFIYRSSRPSPQNLTVQATLENGTLLRANRPFPTFRLSPPAVQIVQPLAGIIEKTAPAFDTPVTDLAPQTMEVTIAISWPDQRPRGLRSIEYTLNGSLRATVDQEALVDPPAPETISIADLDTGIHTLRIRVVDELGLVGESPGHSMEVFVDRPAAPDLEATAVAVQATADMSIRLAQETAAAERAADQAAVAETRTADQAAVALARATDQARATTEAIAAEARIDAVVTETDAALRNLSWVTVGSGGVAVAALIFAVVAWRNPRVRRRATEIVTGAIQAVTEPFFGGSGGGKSTAKARLHLMDGDPSLPATIDLYGGNTRVGRDAALVNAVVDDRRISRLHCRIGEEASGAFRVWDEGSSSGTYVNGQRVEMAGRVLQPGDMLQVGPVTYRFEPLTAQATQVAGGRSAAGMHDATEPFVVTTGDPARANPLQDSATQYDFAGLDDATRVDLADFDAATQYAGTQYAATQYDQTQYDSTQYVVDDDGDNDPRATGFGSDTTYRPKH